MTAPGDDAFRFETSVRFGDTDRTLHATPMALYGYLQESAILHSESVGLGAADLAARSRAWVLNRIHIQYERYPSWRDAVAVETWIAEIAGLYAVREFILRDAAGQTLCTATSRWVFLDTARMRPIRIPGEFGAPYGSRPVRAVDDPFPRHGAVEHAEISREFHVRISDLDPNDHANSACYIDWCVEAAPACRERRLAAIELSYKAEAQLGDGLHAQGQLLRESDGEIEFVHTIHNLTRKNVAALGRTRWIKPSQP